MVVVDCTNLKHWKMGRARSIGRWIWISARHGLVSGSARPVSYCVVGPLPQPVGPPRRYMSNSFVPRLAWSWLMAKGRLFSATQYSSQSFLAWFRTYCVAKHFSYLIIHFSYLLIHNPNKCCLLAICHGIQTWPYSPLLCLPHASLALPYPWNVHDTLLHIAPSCL